MAIIFVPLQTSNHQQIEYYEGRNAALVFWAAVSAGLMPPLSWEEFDVAASMGFKVKLGAKIRQRNGIGSKLRKKIDFLAHNEPIITCFLLNLHRFGFSAMDISREILQFLHYHPQSSREDIASGTAFDGSDATMKRLIAAGIRAGNIVAEGKARATRYSLTPQAHLMMPLNLDTYFALNVDERQMQTAFNFSLIRDQLPLVRLFTDEEQERLQALQAEFRQHVAEMSEGEYRKEMERLGIDLSWKSSQIEGNTYSLLETERLLRESKTADGKTKEEAVMLLNHKDALRFVLDNPDYLQPLSVSRIEDIHRLLTKELSVDRGIRRRRVGITGTNYHPLDNEFQIREAMQAMCDVINGKSDVFEKSLLAIVLLSYIQAFSDGNKRTARITGNAILIANGYCPLSFRSVDSIDYKKAMLIFYEQNNLYAFKQIFIDQFEFAVREYF